MSDPVANRLQKDFLEALEQEKLRPGVEAKRLTAERKKAYDLRLKFCRRQATADFINNADNKPKAIWDTINSERQKKCTESAIELEVDGKKTQNPLQIAEHLNTYFTTVAEKTLKEAESVSKNISISPPPESIILCDLTIRSRGEDACATVRTCGSSNSSLPLLLKLGTLKLITPRPSALSTRP
ncbi:hypothetical protein J6590_107112 [Homalodisca vitripennis]|nr:hypothetical protein J6590_107112 [Homalodisca vitripennis]